LPRAITLSVAALGAVVFAGIAVVGTYAARHQERFGPGAQPVRLAIPVWPGQQACQAPVELQGDSSAVDLLLATYLRPGPPLTLTLRDLNGGTPLATGRLAGGYPDNSRQTIGFPIVRGGPNVAVCLRNEGSFGVVIYGDDEDGAPTSEARIGGKPIDADMWIVFRNERSLTETLPDIFRRAALFRPRWVGPWTFWVLAAAVIFAVPLLLAGALASAVRTGESRPPEDRSQRA
jgi:hypothetical protein